MQKIEFTYNANTQHLTVTGVTAEGALRFLNELAGVAPRMDAINAPDALRDAMRPAGTPVSKLHRELEDAVADSHGELAVTHALGGTPVLVPKGDEPVGVPQVVPRVPRRDPEPVAVEPVAVPAEPEPEPVAKRGKKKPPPRNFRGGVDVVTGGAKIAVSAAPTIEDAEPEQAAPAAEPEAPTKPEQAAPEVDRDNHSRRWAGVPHYNDSNGKVTITGYTVTGDYTVILDLLGGARVWLDESDREIRREDAPAGPDTDSGDGDFRLATPPTDAPAPEPAQEPAQVVDIPPAAIAATKLREFVTVFADRVEGRGVDVAKGIIAEVVAAAPYNTGMSNHTDLYDRTLRVLMVLGRITQAELVELKA